MVFSKSLGYAVRGILYVSIAEKKGQKVQLAEIANQIGVPRHFLGKVMKKMVKENILGSMKGPYGGFFITENTMKTPLSRLMEITGEDEKLRSCVLKLRKCSAQKPCPMHAQVESLRNQWKQLLVSTTIGDLLKKGAQNFLKSIATP